MELEEAKEIIENEIDGCDVFDCKMCERDCTCDNSPCVEEGCQLAIAVDTVLQELDRLKKENEELKTERDSYRTQVNSAFDKGFIHKDKIREKIEEYKNSKEFYQNFPDDYMGDIAISLLQDLLKEE